MAISGIGSNYNNVYGSTSAEAHKTLLLRTAGGRGGSD